MIIGAKCLSVRSRARPGLSVLPVDLEHSIIGSRLLWVLHRRQEGVLLIPVELVADLEINRPFIC